MSKVPGSRSAPMPTRSSPGVAWPISSCQREEGGSIGIRVGSPRSGTRAGEVGFDLGAGLRAVCLGESLEEAQAAQLVLLCPNRLHHVGRQHRANLRRTFVT